MSEGVEFYITPQTAREFANLGEVKEAEIAEAGKRVWDTLPYATKLAITCFVSKSLQKSQTYRHWIYSELGLKEDAYAPVFLNGGLNITNAMFEWFDREAN